MTSVAIIDDHSVVRLGIRFVLMTDKRFEFVAEADDGAQAVELIEKHHPDILLLDVRMPGVSGLEALEKVLKRFPDQKVVMLTMSDAEEDVFRAISLGAHGYVIKDNAPEKIISALDTVANGGMCVSEELMKVYQMRSAERGLSDRQKEILRLVSRGLSNEEIAKIVNLSFYTVKNHLKNIFAALEAADRAEAVATGIRRGIIE